MNQDDRQRLFIKRLEQVTPEQFVTFLAAKRVTAICPGCGREGEQVVDESNHITLDKLLKNDKPNVFVTFFKHQSATPGDSDINYFYKLTCAYCGYITMHSVSSVLRWLDDEKHQENGEHDE